MEQSREQLQELFNKACEDGEVSSIRTIFKSYPGYINLENNDGYGFKKACEKGYVNIIDYLVKTKEVVNNIDLDFQENIGFYIACDYNQLEVIKYYFNHRQYQSMKGLINTLYIKSCETNNLPMYQVLKQFEMLNKINPQWNNLKGFKLACQQEMTEVIHDIIFTMNLPLKEDLKQWLKDEKYERVLNTFNKRDIYNSLK